MLQGAAMLNGDCEIIYCNPSLADLLGVARTSVVGVHLQDFLDPADRQTCERLVERAQSGPTESEMRLRLPDGTLIPANLSFQVLARDPSTIGVLVSDLTTQKSHAELTARLQTLQDEERKRIARELHDSVGQLLTAVSLNIQRVRAELHKLTPETARLVEDNSVMIDQVSREIRTISHLLHPPLLDVAGLASALRWYADGFSERSKIKIQLEIPEQIPRLRSDIEIAVFRMVQECLANIRRHSGADSCSVLVRQEKDGLRVVVQDRGRGIPEAKRTNFFLSAGDGLRGLHERIQQLGGTLEIDSNEKGTKVVAVLPLAGPV
jgi:PAS domain S-box-containing protein